MSTKIKAVLGLSSLTPEAKVTRAQGIKDAMFNSSNFPAGQMPIAYNTIQSLINDLHNAILATNAGTTASTSEMHEQERLLVTAFNLVKAHVEYVANNTTNAATIINSAGMQVAQSGGASGVSELTLDAAGNGSIIVRVPRASSEKAFVYELSMDNISFTRITSSSLAKITISNQQPGTTVYVRYYAISKTGEGAISQSKSVIVL